MLAIILSTVFAGHYTRYKALPLQDRHAFASQAAAKHLSAGNFEKAEKWMGHAQRSWQRAQKVKEIDALLTALTEKRGQLEQVVREAQDAAEKADGVKSEVATISSQIDELTAQRNQLMSNIVSQAVQADAVAAKVTADVAEQPSMPTQESVPQEGGNQPTLGAAPEVAAEAVTRVEPQPAVASIEPTPAVVEPSSVVPAQSTEEAVQKPAGSTITEAAAPAPQPEAAAPAPATQPEAAAS